jgi:hypothetical protein
LLVSILSLFLHFVPVSTILSLFLWFCPCFYDFVPVSMILSLASEFITLSLLVGIC